MMRTTKLLTGLALLAALAACAGRAPNPVATSQPQDAGLPCPVIQSEIAYNNQRIQQLSGEKGGKTAQNVAAGVAGLLIWPIWFAMDFQDTQDIEIGALQGRNNTLAAMATTKCTTVATTAPIAPAPIATVAEIAHPAAVAANEQRSVVSHREPVVYLRTN